jgi:CHASE3 domain sensor protein/anti-sigma regulatory factor (Ser/Thr protein kinase)
MQKVQAFMLEKWKSRTLQQKLMMLFIVTSVIILAVNMYMYSIVNEMTGRIEEVYDSNVSLNNLAGALDDVQQSMEEYLNTKSSDALEDYYRSDQAYRERLEELNLQVTDNELLLMQKNIHNLSESYLDVAAEAIQAKRNRNVERYGRLYEDAEGLYAEIHTFIYSLNNAQFKDNSQNYQVLRDSMRYTEMVSLVVLFLVLLINVGLIYISARAVTIRRENELKAKELLMQSHLKDAQLKYLQAQINPHFLFNTLNAGAQLAMMEDAERTGVFLENVAEFYRYNVRRNNQDAALGEEIHLVDNYMYILNVRFAGEILFEKDIDESLMNIRVPSMILQPIVENAVNHGIRGIEWQGRIELSVHQKGTEIRISIWDNGAGMEADRIRQVLSGEVKENESGSNGVGLGNVAERLKLYFHDQARLEIFSEGKNKGTEILITIPKEGKDHVPNNAGRR